VTKRIWHTQVVAFCSQRPVARTTVDRSTHADYQHLSFCHRNRCLHAERRMSCRTLIVANSDRCRRRGWYGQLGMQAPGQTTTGAPGMQLCTRLVVCQKAVATGVAQAWCGRAAKLQWLDVYQRAALTISS